MMIPASISSYMFDEVHPCQCCFQFTAAASLVEVKRMTLSLYLTVIKPQTCYSTGCTIHEWDDGALLLIDGGFVAQFKGCSYIL